jgi:hypothetical protein
MSSTRPGRETRGRAYLALVLAITPGYSSYKLAARFYVRVMGGEVLRVSPRRPHFWHHQDFRSALHIEAHLSWTLAPTLLLPARC